MEAQITYTNDDIARTEIRQFVNNGLQDVYNNNLLDFDNTFNELEKKYSNES